MSASHDRVPFLWLTLPEPWLSGAFKNAAAAENILIDDEDEYKAGAVRQGLPRGPDRILRCAGSRPGRRRIPHAAPASRPGTSGLRHLQLTAGRWIFRIRRYVRRPRRAREEAPTSLQGRAHGPTQRARHHARTRRRSRPEARRIPAHPRSDRARADADRARHLLRHVERALLLQELEEVAAHAADHRARSSSRGRARMPA